MPIRKARRTPVPALSLTMTGAAALAIPLILFYATARGNPAAAPVLDHTFPILLAAGLGAFLLAGTFLGLRWLRSPLLAVFLFIASGLLLAGALTLVLVPPEALAFVEHSLFST